MRKRRLAALAAALALVVAGELVCSGDGKTPRVISREECLRVRPGMSMTEVVAVLGPAVYYTTGPTRVGPPVVLWETPGRGRGREAGCIWRTDTANVLVVFDGSGRAVALEYSEASPLRGEEASAGLFTWIARQWRRLWR